MSVTEEPVTADDSYVESPSVRVSQVPSSECCWPNFVDRPIFEDRSGRL